MAPRAVSGLTRAVQHDAPLMACPADDACPASGVWQPWVDASHPLQAIVNQHWRQVWLTKGQAFDGRPGRQTGIAINEQGVNHETPRTRRHPHG
ncbi:hypothetical protein GJA_589 [Janthinobacterium agaricidamnosum NBRC 102515 = DSM 9628]|uniref:Uncharacterized protein n=1 Tax=Janthinobacterium agaricidamnosum NBRC 102515 = DSM 9628 TaxID=1349767 RepID=W0V1N2_9BURK|nr:hypothetical protein GJA_589 [Janthinobacterium agaricidamnosum NBRC 102515 = DSM 9628]